MRFRLFKARDGDCNLITAADGTNMLVDGGRATQFKAHAAPALAVLRRNGEVLDVVAVSHIDNDHLEGIIELLDQKVAWVVHRHQIDPANPEGNPDHPEPKFEEPPEIREIWHNGFREQQDENAGVIEDQLAAATRLAFFSSSTDVQDLAERMQKLVAGERDAIRLQRRLRSGLLHIQHNQLVNGRLLMVNDQTRQFDIGGLTVRLIGPRAEDLERLRNRWNDWLEDSQDILANLTNRVRALDRDPSLNEAERVKLRLELAAAELGDFSGLSPPNVASIMFLVQEGGHQALMTGDGASQHVLRGLQDAGVVAAGEGLHVDILKVPHHGAAANTSPEFPRLITADHYVFCSNGSHHNPETEVIEAYINSRLGTPSQRSTNPEVDQPFTFWFTYDPDVNTLTTNQKDQMDAVKRLIQQTAATEPRMSFEFVAGDEGLIDLDG